MATWDQLQAYVNGQYKVAEQTPSMMKLLFDLGNGRSQFVLIYKLTLEGGLEEWAQIESPIGKVQDTPLGAALEIVSNTVVGGLAKTGEYLVLRHCVPSAISTLMNLNGRSCSSRPLRDQLEASLLGVDTF